MPQRIFDTCQVKGCDRPHKSRGYCNTHYAQFKRGVPICEEIKGRDRNKPEECSEEGCHEPVKSKGLCSMHYARLLRHGFTRPTKRTRDPKPCLVEGCTDHVYSKGLCHRHYMQKRNLEKRQWKGISDIGQYQEMLKAQNGVCLICKKEERIVDGKTLKPKMLAVDHCHTHGHVRGLLCSACNTALGLFQDDPDLIRRAALYLERGADGL